MSEMRRSIIGNRTIAPTQKCTHEIKNVFMMLILVQVRLNKGQEGQYPQGQGPPQGLEQILHPVGAILYGCNTVVTVLQPNICLYIQGEGSEGAVVLPSTPLSAANNAGQPSIRKNKRNLRQLLQVVVKFLSRMVGDDLICRILRILDFFSPEVDS